MKQKEVERGCQLQKQSEQPHRDTKTRRVSSTTHNNGDGLLLPVRVEVCRATPESPGNAVAETMPAPWLALPPATT